MKESSKDFKESCYVKKVIFIEIPLTCFSPLRNIPQMAINVDSTATTISVIAKREIKVNFNKLRLILGYNYC